MATINTKYSIGDKVYCLDKYGTARERIIMGIRTQDLGHKTDTIYSFVKDFAYTQDYLQQGEPMYSGNDFFWLPENKVYESKQELLNSL